MLALDVPDGDPVGAAAMRVRARLWGGGAVSSGELVERLEGAGFVAARANPPVGGYRMFAARRAPAEVAEHVQLEPEVRPGCAAAVARA